MAKNAKMSKLGYSVGSPYRNSPFLDIHTPEGLIDMSNTDIPLHAVDETGYEKILMPFSGMHKFRGSNVRETPMKKGGKLTANQYLTERGLRDAHNHGDFDNISPNQAREILHKKKVNGKALTPEQYRLFGFLSKGNTLKYQSGGLTGNKRYDFLFGDDEEETSNIEESDKPTAPSVGEIQQEQPEDNSQDQLAMEVAMNTWSSSGNPYQEQGQSNVNTNGIDPAVMAASNELMQKFPGLRVTSGIRNWGDEDAHPKGRAMDLAGPNLEAAFNYYKNQLVPKYHFNQALNPNHGTGPHIHVGYYQYGGMFTPKY